MFTSPPLDQATLRQRGITLDEIATLQSYVPSKTELLFLLRLQDEMLQKGEPMLKG